MKPTQLCEADGCRDQKYRRKWCSIHYRRWLKHGDPHKGGERHYKNPEESFAARTRQEGSCIVWTGTKVPNGYGVIYKFRSRMLAHRYAWERERGPIPDGMLIDHACFNRECVNVEHLRIACKSTNGAYREAAQANSQSGIRGVSRRSDTGKWVAQVHHKGFHYRKSHDCIEAAIADVNRVRAERFGEYAGPESFRGIA